MRGNLKRASRRQQDGTAPPLERLALRKLGIAESAVEAAARRLRVSPVRVRTALARYGIRLRRGEGS